MFQETTPGRFALNATARRLLDPGERIGLDLEGTGGRFAHTWGDPRADPQLALFALDSPFERLVERLGLGHTYHLLSMEFTVIAFDPLSWELNPVGEEFT